MPEPRLDEEDTAAPIERSDAPAALAPRMQSLDVLLLVLAWSAACTVLGVAAWLRPDPTGHGTHTQLGLPPCGMMVNTGIPCPSCGMTTAFAFAIRGNVIESLRAQPFGTLLFLGTVLVALAAPVALVRRIPVLARMDGARPVLALKVVALLFALAWAWKIATTLSR